MTIEQGNSHLDDSFGAAFLGNIFAAVLYGVTCLQIFIYYKNSGKDSLGFRLIICFLWVLDTLQLALVTHALYYYLIQNFSNPYALVMPNWSVLVQMHVTVASDFIVRTIYARRVWIITKRNIPLAIVIGATSFAAFGGGVAFPSRAFSAGSFRDLHRFSYFLYLALGFGMVADTMVAATLCISLSRSRTGFKKMDTILGTLMIYTINSSLLTFLCSALCFITYAVWPMKYIFIAFYFCLSKLFLNSLLAMLNGRSALQERSSRLTAAAHPLEESAEPWEEHREAPITSEKMVHAVGAMQSRDRVQISVERFVESDSI